MEVEILLLYRPRFRDKCIFAKTTTFTLDKLKGLRVRINVRYGDNHELKLVYLTIFYLLIKSHPWVVKRRSRLFFFSIQLLSFRL